IRVRSLFTAPGDGVYLPPGPVALRGIAWSGHGPIQRVEVGVGVGGPWLPARVGEPLEGTGPVRWSHDWTPPTAGMHTLGVRATDAAGHQQPESSIWNAGGYGNNVIHRISVEVE
ncbi:MAG: sulfite oxidase, partial [Candidatus Limnocylindria bacterium]